ncbi:membrane-bound PQQ-dependent dehydrogenase (glucose/quinate/shikimate family) [Sphingomonas sp. BE270]|jgi:quinoprotein glucose dehydrogenase|uniref:membrane-bound PQQ-dependent dehydrogenase, glucose/quinate/shikimate family n=1 Tax=Sphingomonas sp. BE270 TaxID=2817726 RepID=UPI002854EAE4|nr:membrane-bound PQQ-dependent dehydrogenase, glucose/quinate/shikimate family [Sphingomonas sp. BE270]MDR7260088.1 membrane-bound PQQ-dependent dehydrogenase (glucose/quinate/shikimate family) [Sphingomonas sp. BE270]
MMSARSHIPSAIYAILLVLIGVAYALGGAQLALLGGSWYYLITGIAVVISGFLIWRGNAWGAWLYALMLSWTFVWALLEAGIDFWSLLPRLFGPFLFGLWLLTPWSRKSLTSGPRPIAVGRAVTGAFAVAFLAIIVIGFSQGDIHEVKAAGALPAIASAYTLDHPEGDWQFYGNDQGGKRFSPLTQLTPDNVSGLQVAWTYRTGDYPPPEGPDRRLEVTPLKIGDSLYLCSGRNKVIALDAETGKERWVYDPHPNLIGVTGSAACRGVAYYKVPNAAGACAERIYGPTVDARLVVLDARTGRLCKDFAAGGILDLKTGLGEVGPGYYYVSSAPQIVRGKVVVGGWISDGQKTGEPAGIIRGFDAVTGALVWAFDMGNPEVHTEPGPGQQYTRGTPNSWAPISADEELGLVFLPTGNATPDYWGGHRTDLDNRFSSSVIALDAATGALRWQFQTTHYDVWDYDVGSQPSLIDLTINGKTVPALVQETKRGQNFVLDRRNGKPLFAVAEKSVPQGGAENPARLSRTQPFSVGMPAFDGLDPREPLGLTEKDMWGVTPFDQLYCRIKFRKARWEGTLTPFGLDHAIDFPGSLGGSNWSSASYDPERHIMVGNWNRVPMYGRLMPRAEADARGLKPADGRPGVAVGGTVPQAGTPYAAELAPFLSPLGAPCIAPPYGLVTAIDLNTRKVIWTRRSGTAEDSGVFGIKTHLPIPMGIPGLGGAITTKSGLVFIAASGEQSLRAMDLRSGDILWKKRLPAGGNATPMTYLSPASGRQFVVIAAGGHNLMATTPGDFIIAYALPKSR